MKTRLQGEFWIEEGGTAAYCDGGVGDIGHAGYVIEAMRGRIADHFGLNYWDANRDWENIKAGIVEEQAPDTELDQYDAVFDRVARENGFGDEELGVAEGDGDACFYAMVGWGWKRMVGNTVETWMLTQEDIDTIVNGMWDAYQEEINDDTEVVIYVAATKESYELTIRDLERMSVGLNEGRPSSTDIDLVNEAASRFDLDSLYGHRPSCYHRYSD